ncbi:hypothetical protein Cob_v006216 [Colletotrichum orbiculare MAFF 240422]|uniref:Uncharacterized protein n=1 Tax=Colletotrichum orbiculare (strain 104-T / ATCC 96160 / CBS 514.97 / LARS 414 / MAFF 240422) TaxID=1213857 RepID=A0A484FSC0_COLOR|nr:hypothetical protein Cob_v006216 [Colletotrichum orbiculare MAFF 240422]
MKRRVSKRCLRDPADSNAKVGCAGPGRTILPSSYKSRGSLFSPVFSSRTRRGAKTRGSASTTSAACALLAHEHPPPGL